MSFFGDAGGIASLLVAGGGLGAAAVKLDTWRARKAVRSDKLNQIIANQENQALALKEADVARATALELATAKTAAGIQEIHTLVNGALTTSIQAELDATRRELTLMMAVKDPDEMARTAIEVTKARIEELSVLLSTRRDAERQIAIRQAEMAAADARS